MKRKTRNELLIGFTLSVLLSLFANLAMMVQRYELIVNGAVYQMGPGGTGYEMENGELWFSLGWFFLFAFTLAIIFRSLYLWGKRIYRHSEVKTLGFTLGICLLVAFGLFKAYPTVHHVVMSQLQKPASIEVTESETVGPDGRTVHLFEQADSAPAAAPTDAYEYRGLRTVVPGMNTNAPLLIEHTFVALTVLLTGLMILLFNKRQRMKTEYEKIKAEQLQNSYDALMGQINPHFFFNSLNGLNSLIRTGEQARTLEYLDGLSGVFRYILQSNRKTLVTLDEEMQFTRAYTHLLSVRYEHKLFFSIRVDERCLTKTLPILSLLPLIENAVKHNVISKQHPLQIGIYTESCDLLVVSNPVQPKQEEDVCNGIGLKNLRERYRMLTGRGIEVSETDGHYTVSLPLTDKLVQS